MDEHLYADGVSRETAPGAAAERCRSLCAAADQAAAPQRISLRSDAVRMLDAFLAMVPPHERLETGWLPLLAEGAKRFQQGEYAWPVAQLGLPLPEGTGLPLPPPFTSVVLPDSRIAVMRSDWTPRAHYLAVHDGHACQDLPRFALCAFGETLATECGGDGGGGGPAGGAPRWATGLFLDALAQGERAIGFVKPVGDLPGYWLVTEQTGGSWTLRSPLPLAGNGGMVTASAGDGRPGLQIMPAQAQNLRQGLDATGHWLAFDGAAALTVLLAPYERIAPAPGSFQVQPFSAAQPGARCWRILHPLGYDLLVLGDGTPADFPELELTTDAQAALLRMRGGLLVAQQAARCSTLHFRGEELAK